jgi:predicted metal-binding membrane protein
MRTRRSSERAFHGVAAVLFVASVAATIVWCASMSAMGTMTMDGGGSMSTVWMRMPGQTWAGAAASFLMMWIVMMAAMMLPSLVPLLVRYREAVCESGEGRLALLTALVGAAYFLVWAVLGLVVFPIVVALAALEMRLPLLARVVPFAVGMVVIATGALQLTAWKARHLLHLDARDPSDHEHLVSQNAGSAWRHGLRLGVHCCCCCAGLTASFIALGMMDLRAMAVVTAAITAERVSPASARVAHVVGVIGIVAGSVLIARAAGVG